MLITCVPDSHSLNTLQMWTLGPRTKEACVNGSYLRGESICFGLFSLETAKVLVPFLVSGGGVY